MARNTRINKKRFLELSEEIKDRMMDATISMYITLSKGKYHKNIVNAINGKLTKAEQEYE